MLLSRVDQRALSLQRQVVVPVCCDGLKFDERFRLDVMVEDSVMCAWKTVSELNVVCTAQLLTYLRVTGKRVGFLINFNGGVIKYESLTSFYNDTLESWCLGGYNTR